MLSIIVKKLRQEEGDEGGGGEATISVLSWSSEVVCRRKRDERLEKENQ